MSDQIGLLYHTFRGTFYQDERSATTQTYPPDWCGPPTAHLHNQREQCSISPGWAQAGSHGSVSAKNIRPAITVSQPALTVKAAARARSALLEKQRTARRKAGITVRSRGSDTHLARNCHNNIEDGNTTVNRKYQLELQCTRNIKSAMTGQSAGQSLDNTTGHRRTSSSGPIFNMKLKKIDTVSGGKTRPSTHRAQRRSSFSCQDQLTGVHCTHMTSDLSKCSPLTTSSGYNSDRELAGDVEMDGVWITNDLSRLRQCGRLTQEQLSSVNTTHPVTHNTMRRPCHNTSVQDDCLQEVSESMCKIIHDLNNSTDGQKGLSRSMSWQGVNPVDGGVTLGGVPGWRGGIYRQALGPCDHISPAVAGQITPPRYMDMSGLINRGSKVWRKRLLQRQKDCHQRGEDYCDMVTPAPVDTMHHGAVSIGHGVHSAFKPYRRDEQDTSRLTNLAVPTSTPLVPSRPARRRPLFVDVPHTNPAVDCSEIYSPTSVASSDSGNASSSSTENIAAASGTFWRERQTSCGDIDYIEEGVLTDEEEPIYETIPEEDSLLYSRPTDLSRSMVEASDTSFCDENTYASITCTTTPPRVEPPQLPPRTYRKRLTTPTKHTHCLAGDGVRRPEDVVKKSDIVDFAGSHLYTVGDVLDSFKRLSANIHDSDMVDLCELTAAETSRVPVAHVRQNLYSLLEDQDSRRQLSDTLEAETKFNTQIYNADQLSPQTGRVRGRREQRVSASTMPVYAKVTPKINRSQSVINKCKSEDEEIDESFGFDPPSGARVSASRVVHSLPRNHGNSVINSAQKDGCTGGASIERSRSWAHSEFHPATSVTSRPPRSFSHGTLGRPQRDVKPATTSQHDRHLQWMTSQHLQETFC